MGSRRGSEELIRAGRVMVDGVVAHIGDSVDPEQQTITVDGRPLAPEAKEYWLLNKPRGVVSTAADPQGRRTVVDCVPTGTRIFPVGRLDRDTTGLLSSPTMETWLTGCSIPASAWKRSTGCRPEAACPTRR